MKENPTKQRNDKMEGKKKKAGKKNSRNDRLLNKKKKIVVNICALQVGCWIVG